MNAPQFYRTRSGEQTIFRCHQCKYDTFSRDSIDAHCKIHPILTMPGMELSTPEWIANTAARNHLRDVKIGLGLLTWNTNEASYFAATSLQDEMMRLKALGMKSQIIWADNGSDDGTKNTLLRRFGDKMAIPLLFEENVGQSRARNSIIATALNENCDYLLMLDGDSIAVAFSTYAMAQYLDSAPEDEGCIGMHCHNSTHNHQDVTSQCRCIQPWMVDHDSRIAWTNYGLFRCSVIRRIKFEERGPFGGPGWGFEDDDYGMSMTMLGYTSVNTKYFRYWHNYRHSSMHNLGQSLAAKVYAERKAFLLDKWRSIKEVESHLERIANQSMPEIARKESVAM